MEPVSGLPSGPVTKELRSVGQALSGATDEQIIRAVRMIDTLAERGAADALIEPVRPHLRRLQPPRRLNFTRVLLHPFNPAIMPPGVWRKDPTTLPRDRMVRMARTIRNEMAQEAAALDATLAGHTTEDVVLISKVGRNLWPQAAKVLRNRLLADRGLLAEHGDPQFGPLGATTALLLAEAPALDALAAETANGMLPPRTEAIREVVVRVLSANDAALPVFMTMLLARLPQAMACLDDLLPGRLGARVRRVRDDAATMLLQRLLEDEDIGGRIAAGSLADASRTAKAMLAFLTQLGLRQSERDLRAPIGEMRRKLDLASRDRFRQALEEDLLQPLRAASEPLDAATATALQAVARGLRALETTARTAGSGPIYDKLLTEAAEAVAAPAMRGRLNPAEQMRFVETLAGSQAAVAMVARP